MEKLIIKLKDKDQTEFILPVGVRAIYRDNQTIKVIKIAVEISTDIKTSSLLMQINEFIQNNYNNITNIGYEVSGIVNFIDIDINTYYGYSVGTLDRSYDKSYEEISITSNKYL